MTYQTFPMPKTALKASNRARDLLHDLVYQVYISAKRGGKPGELILSLPEEQRKTLRDLKSEDIKVVRWPKL